ncbi:uncharacterized protein MELLADRAFT_76398 [Melampsora larici-populina 98AG31]|uniref:Uncharacterized protein n=1 Tax=Melampsora larici-populina (strain 98AG31 / pathotype 3-4-7) TaxID=747676 RepID=F4R4U6_MELLP|nr:uncharacterized protein MELLADRAFT_76398 [Melampsora larici-populina 98AG31]EGG12871.1 hypothetical protein MELLADRAFT_76398 [Melampsora larici-populina 98AG31]
MFMFNQTFKITFNTHLQIKKFNLLGRASWLLIPASMALQKSRPRIQFIEPIKNHHQANITADSIVSSSHQSTSTITPPHNSPLFSIATPGQRVRFHPIVRIIFADGQSDKDPQSPHCRSPTNWPDSKLQRRMRLGTKTLSLPLSLSPHRPHPVRFLSPTAGDFPNISHSRQSVLARTQREIEEDDQFIPAPVRTIKLTIPSLTRRPSSKKLRVREEERIRRCAEAHGGKIKSCLKRPSSGFGATPSIPRSRRDSNEVGIAISTNTMRNVWISRSPQPGITEENVSSDNQLHWNQAVEDTPVFTSNFHPSPTNSSESDSVGPKSPLETNEDTDSDKSSPDSTSHPEDSHKSPVKGLNRLAKKLSGSALHFRFFTPKPQRWQLPDDDQEIIQDEMEELELSIPEPDLITSKDTPRSWLPVLSLRKRASNIEQRSRLIDQDNDSNRQEYTGQPAPLEDDPLTIDDTMKDRLLVRSNSYHHDHRALPSTSGDPIFNTDPYGETTSTSLSMSLSTSLLTISPGITRSNTTLDRTLTAQEQGLKPCCETCEEAASKGLQADHEIPFSPRALEIYRSRAWYLDDIVVEDAKKVEIGDASAGNYPSATLRNPLPNRIRTLRCSIHKRDVSLDMSGEFIIPPLPPMPNTSQIKKMLPIETNKNIVPSPCPKSYECHLNQKLGLGVQYESTKV